MKISAEKTDKTDDKQCQRHPEGDQCERTEAGYCNKLQILEAVVSDDGSNPEVLKGLHKPLKLLQS